MVPFLPGVRFATCGGALTPGYSLIAPAGAWSKTSFATETN